MYPLTNIDDLTPDVTNPRASDPARMHLLKVSLRKLGFILPVIATTDGLLLSGHQRLKVAKELGWKEVPVHQVSVASKDVQGINILANRATNDFGALENSKEALKNIDLATILAEAEELPDSIPETWAALQCKDRAIVGLAAGKEEMYDKKAILIAENFMRKSIRIPIVVSESGEIINGVHRMFAAREQGITSWPTITLPNSHAKVAQHMLNYLSMDYDVGEGFARILRYGAYRRPQNARGSVPKAYRFWANGEKTLPDKDSYSVDYWRTFRDLHGTNLLDFGAGLGKVAPFLNAKGFRCVDFEPYRIDPESDAGTPSPLYSKQAAREFLQTIANPDLRFDSIFLASVMNSIPFPKDRMCVLAICNALSEFDTVTYGTCRAIEDFQYEYSGIRVATYFVFDSEPGVRLGDAMNNPKLQKFHTPEEFTICLKFLYNTVTTYPGGNVFFWRAANPKRPSMKVLGEALAFEFDLPYADGSTMSLVKEAKEAFSQRLGKRVP